MDFSIIMSMFAGVGGTLLAASIIWLVTSTSKNKEDIRVLQNDKKSVTEMQKSITEIKESLHKIEIIQATTAEHIQNIKGRN